MNKLKEVMTSPYRSNIEEILSILYFIGGVVALSSSYRFLKYFSIYLFFSAFKCTVYAIVAAILTTISKPDTPGPAEE